MVPHHAPAFDDDEQQLVARASALAFLVSTAPNRQVAAADLGRLVLAATNSRGESDETLRMVLHSIPVTFSVRDGWASPQLRQALQVACALNFVILGAGGNITAGPAASRATEMLDPRTGWPRPWLVSAPRVAGD